MWFGRDMRASIVKGGGEGCREGSVLVPVRGDVRDGYKILMKQSNRYISEFIIFRFGRS